jgi:hypothetical protein
MKTIYYLIITLICIGFLGLINFVITEINKGLDLTDCYDIKILILIFIWFILALFILIATIKEHHKK